MRISIPGLVLAVVIYCVEFLLFTYYVIGCFTYITSWHTMLNVSREFVDEVIDTGQVTEQMETDFNLALASNEVVYHANIYREVKKVDPDPTNLGTDTTVGGTVTSWIVVEDYSQFNSGDRVVVEIQPISVSVYEAISNLVLRLPPNSNKIVKAGRIR